MSDYRRFGAGEFEQAVAGIQLDFIAGKSDLYNLVKSAHVL